MHCLRVAAYREHDVPSTAMTLCWCVQEARKAKIAAETAEDIARMEEYARVLEAQEKARAAQFKAFAEKQEQLAKVRVNALTAR